MNLFVKSKFCRWAWLFPAALVLVLTGCSHLFTWTAPGPPKAEVKSNLFVTNAIGNVSTMDVLQLKVMRLADDYVATVAQAADDFGVRVGTPEGRLTALKWKLGQATSAYTDASGVNPVINALDMLVLITLARTVIEDYGVETYGTNALPLLATQRKFEAGAWELANAMLKPAQRVELQNMIQEWRDRHPHQRYIGPIRFIEFATALGRKPQASSSSPNSIFSLLFINPLAGLDPTTAAIEEAQQFGERLMYYGQRMPLLISWQSEVMAYELAGQPESKQILSNSQQLATSAAIFAQTAAAMPKVINDQRQAAIDQVFDRLMSEETKTRELLLETRKTFAAGSEAAQSINAAIKSLDDFVRYVSPPSTNTASSSTNSRPFNILDYGMAASQIGAAAKDLNATLQTMNETTPQLLNLSQEATVNANRVVNHAFWKGVILIVILMMAAVVAALTYRFLAHRITSRQNR
ncbi:MAG TPA: hypothetical protein VL863_05020 [bacterium]|nr:hypothetical protein [bacterium]